jgi:hypothetical protein
LDGFGFETVGYQFCLLVELGVGVWEGRGRTYDPERKRKIMLCGDIVSGYTFQERRRSERVKSIHQSVREPHFSSVDDAIAYAFYEREDVVVLWV